MGIGREDTEEDIKRLTDKIIKLRIMSDKAGKMNRSILDVGGEILVVSQFTLYANTNEGRRPSFTDAALPDKAESLYELFIDRLKKLGVKKVASGEFGAYMIVEIHNDGPITIFLDSRNTH